MFTPAGDRPHFRVIWGPNNHRTAAVFLRLSHQLMNSGDIGTGGVQNRISLGLQLAVNVPAFTVGTDQHAGSLGCLVRTFNLVDTLVRQPLHHMAVMDDGTQHDTGCPLLRLLLGQFHRPTDTVAEAGAFCQNDLSHRFSSPRA